MANSITFSKVLDFILNKKERVLKVNEFGVKTAFESMPFGIDSGPLKGMTAIYAKTSNDSEQVIIGYINTNQIAKPGEIRIYCTDSQGIEQGYVYLKNNGEINISGDNYTSVRYGPIKNSIDNTNTNINIELTKIQAAISALGGTYAKSDITTDFNNVESKDVKIK